MINILEPQVYNLIAAGEVVERPASVIKELVENSIDAGAENIDISIENGGITCIRVSDDGKGMSREDLPKSILPHATSKIKAATDLDCIYSLGFRGEALASIATVSKMTITSSDGKDSYCLKADFGVVKEMLPCGRARGTTCEAANLFANTPVRLKFLKKPKQEQAEVTETVIKLIFSRPDISFNYSADGEKIFSTSGGLYDAIYAVYGKEVGDNLIYHERTFDGMSISGYIGKPGYSKHNRNYQTAVINGRVVSNSTVSVAASQAYGGMLMKRCYPVYVLNMTMPAEDLDVNVHPNKKEVRFKDTNAVFSCIYRFFTSALAYQQTHLQFDGEEKQNVRAEQDKPADTYENSRNSYQFGNKSSNITQNITKSDTSNLAENKYAAGQIAENAAEKTPVSDVAQRIKEKISSAERPQPRKPDPLKVSAPLNARSVFERAQERVSRFNSPNKDILKSSSSLIELVNDQLKEDYTVVGQIFKTYLIVERAGKVYLIDQHAVHEKYIYEQYCKQVENAEIASQMLLAPIVFTATSAQYDHLIKLVQPLKDIGFEIEEFGGLSFKVSAVPFVLHDIDIDAFLNDISADDKLIAANLADILKEKLMQRACKKAIKSGDVLSNVQIRKLFASMDEGVPLQCPHGRPAVLTYTKADFDKLFKRIV